jgi:hypothetical protein
MDPALKDLIHRLSPAGLARFCDRAGLSPFNPDGLGPRKLVWEFAAHLRSAPSQNAWHEAEAIAGEVKRLTAAADVCEEALRDTCFAVPEADALVRRAAVIEDRALDLLIKHPDLFRRACNVALGISLAEQKGHARFDASATAFRRSQVDDAANAIRDILQERYGGHRVVADLFELKPHDAGGRRWHITLYIERAAQAALEIGAQKTDLLRPVQRPVHEIGLAYCEMTGNLDVSGKGVGGLPVFQQVANQFSLHTLSGAKLEPVPRHIWRLDRFKSFNPELPSPPDPFATVRVREFCFGAPTKGGGRTECAVGEGGNVYDWMRRSGLSGGSLRSLQVRSVGLEFDTLGGQDGDSTDTVRMVLRWPNGRSFANASPEQQEVLTAWAVSGAFHAWSQGDA